MWTTTSRRRRSSRATPNSPEETLGLLPVRLRVSLWVVLLVVVLVVLCLRSFVGVVLVVVVRLLPLWPLSLLVSRLFLALLSALLLLPLLLPLPPPLLPPLSSRVVVDVLVVLAVPLRLLSLLGRRAAALVPVVLWSFLRPPMSRPHPGATAPATCSVRFLPGPC